MLKRCELGCENRACNASSAKDPRVLAASFVSRGPNVRAAILSRTPAHAKPAPPSESDTRVCPVPLSGIRRTTSRTSARMPPCPSGSHIHNTAVSLAPAARSRSQNLPEPTASNRHWVSQHFCHRPKTVTVLHERHVSLCCRHHTYPRPLLLLGNELDANPGPARERDRGAWLATSAPIGAYTAIWRRWHERGEQKWHLDSW